MIATIVLVEVALVALAVAQVLLVGAALAHRSRVRPWLPPVNVVTAVGCLAGAAEWWDSDRIVLVAVLAAASLVAGGLLLHDLTHDGGAEFRIFVGDDDDR